MSGRWVEQSVAALLGVLIVTDTALMMCVRSLSGESQAAASAAFRRPGSGDGPTPRPDGFTTSGGSLNRVLNSRAGLVVRYAARTCGYCTRDTQWSRLAPQLVRSGYQVLVLLPTAGEAYAGNNVIPSGAPQAAFISMEWLKRFRLTMTPSLLIFSRTGQLIWSRQGMLSPGDPEAAMRAIEGAKSRGNG